MQRAELIKRLEALKDANFAALALAIFQYQATNNPLYAQFLELIGRNQATVKQLQDIPFLPIQLFKNYRIQTGNWAPERVFSSSGTSGSTTSSHLLRDPDFYRYFARQTFEKQYGSLNNFVVLALLPAYLERQGSSLLFMAEDFIQQSDEQLGGFFLYDQEALITRIRQIQATNVKLPVAKRKKILLLGVSFALLDLAERHPQALEDVIIMETGGMKGRREELTRSELHQRLKTAFGQAQIHSEYGMTELLSQAYSPGEGRFYSATTMRVLTREINDPLSSQIPGKTGALNIIDLANIDTISFIATDDLGKVYPDHSFEIMGRLDASDVRGCNLMVADIR